MNSTEIWKGVETIRRKERYNSATAALYFVRLIDMDSDENCIVA